MICKNKLIDDDLVMARHNIDNGGYRMICPHCHDRYVRKRVIETGDMDAYLTGLDVMMLDGALTPIEKVREVNIDGATVLVDKCSNCPVCNVLYDTEDGMWSEYVCRHPKLFSDAEDHIVFENFEHKEHDAFTFLECCPLKRTGIKKEE